VPRRSRRPAVPAFARYTVDASVFVNAFNAHEVGHADSLLVLSAMQRAGDPIIVPTLLLPEVAAAVARATKDEPAALQYTSAIERFPHLTFVTLTPAMARHAAELGARHRLRGADAVYVSVARRYGTTIVSLDEEQRTRASAVVACRTPGRALLDRR